MKSMQNIEWINPFNMFNQLNQRNTLNALPSLKEVELNWRKLSVSGVLIVLIILTLSLLILFLVIFILIKWRSRIDSIDVLYAAFCQRMASHGYARQINEGPQAYACRLSTIWFVDAKHVKKKAAAIEFLRIYEALQYGHYHYTNTRKITKTTKTNIRTLKSLLSQC